MRVGWQVWVGEGEDSVMLFDAPRWPREWVLEQCRSFPGDTGEPTVDGSMVYFRVMDGAVVTLRPVDPSLLTFGG